MVTDAGLTHGDLEIDFSEYQTVLPTSLDSHDRSIAARGAIVDSTELSS